MSVQHFVDDQGRYDGKTLQELSPSVVDEVVRAVDPVEVILFGSVARGEDGPDSDIDPGDRTSDRAQSWLRPRRLVMPTIDLWADLNAEDDEGRNWSLLRHANNPAIVKPGTRLIADRPRVGGCAHRAGRR